MSTKTNIKIYSLISFLVCILFRMEKCSVRTFDKYIFLEYQHLLAAYPYIPFVFHEIYPHDDLDIYWQHDMEVCTSAGISLAALTSHVTPEQMKCLHLHTFFNRIRKQNLSKLYRKQTCN